VHSLHRNSYNDGLKKTQSVNHLAAEIIFFRLVIYSLPPPPKILK
jgi:hypothetical protein